MKPISVIFGLKSVIRRKQKNFFGILAIALGVSLITGITITSQSLSNGFGIFFTYNLGDVDGTITSQKGYMNQSISDIIGSNLVTLQNVTDYTSELSLSVTTSTPTGQMNIQSSLKGINRNDDTTKFGKLLNLDNKEVKISELGQNEVYIGETLANDLRVNINDKMNYSLSIGSVPLEQEVTIKDIVKNEQRGTMGSNMVLLVDLQSLQSEIGPIIQELGFPVNRPITIIYLKFSQAVKTVADGDLLVNQMREHLKNNAVDLSAIGGVDSLIISADRINIKDYGKSLADSLGSLLTIFGSILIIAGLILIINIQLMSIENKEKQIGIQRAVGTKNYQIILSNLTEFVIAGLAGGLLGILGGAIFGWILINAFGYAFGFDGSLIPLTIPSSILLTAFLIGFIISILAGLYPSIKASRINVIEVLRGIENREFKIRQGTGIWGFAFGLLLTILGLLLISGLSKNPLDYPSAYINVDDAEAIYLSTTFLLIGVLVLLSYFISRKTVLTIAGLALFFYPTFQIFFVFDQLKEGSGGEMWVVGMIISLISGSILLVSLNLDTIANFAEKIFSPFFSAISLISFKQMSKQKTRSTLTFAIFAIILTLNIFLASWSYSDRYGSENRVDIMSGGSDIIIISRQPLSSSVSTQYLSELDSKFDSVDHASAFPNSGATDVFLNYNGAINPDTNVISKVKLDIFSVGSQTLMQDNELLYNFALTPIKLNTTKYSFPAPYSSGLELDSRTDSVDSWKQSNIDESGETWKFFSSGLMVTNKTSQKEVPIIITSPIVTLDYITQSMQYLKHEGDSIWLPLKNGSMQEFVIASYSFDNPLFDSYILGQVTGAPGVSTAAFMQEKWASELAAFNPSSNLSLVDQANYYLLSTQNKVNSIENKKLAGDIEAWSNGLEQNSFRSQQGKLYGFLSTTVYSLYETAFDGQFRVFTFMQFFSTLGFLFGVVSLLVVSVRSVQERKREIGMMRSIGVKRSDVVIALILELSVMGTIGLIIGLVIGNILAYGLVHINSGGLNAFLIPWVTIFIYVVLTLGSALFASIIPGRVASTIPPSDALRYTG